jgi:DNA topoisomerase-1
MSSSQINTITAKINVYELVDFVYKTEQVIFPGWMLVQHKYKTDNPEYNYLSSIKKDIQMLPKKITTTFTMIELKTHYSEAGLIKTLEDKGIGRPSTFASLVDKIQDRKYVQKQNIAGVEIENNQFIYDHQTGDIEKQSTKKIVGNENNKLVITSLGVLVIEFLLKYFAGFFDYDYTKEMENELDLVAKGNKEWTLLCDNCYKDLLVYLKEDFKKFEVEIDDEHKIIIGSHGPVIKYTDKTNEKNVKFISLKKDLDLKTILPRSVSLEEIIDDDCIHKSAIGKYKGLDLFIKTGKYGIYAQWGKETRPLKELDKPVDKITYEEVLKILSRDILDPKKPVGLVRELTKYLNIREGKNGNGDYIFYKKPHARKPDFFKLEGFTHDYKKCDKELLINWIQQTYKITV